MIKLPPRSRKIRPRSSGSAGFITAPRIAIITGNTVAPRISTSRPPKNSPPISRPSSFSLRLSDRRARESVSRRKWASRFEASSQSGSSCNACCAASSASPRLQDRLQQLIVRPDLSRRQSAEKFYKSEIAKEISWLKKCYSMPNMLAKRIQSDVLLSNECLSPESNAPENTGVLRPQPRSCHATRPEKGIPSIIKERNTK